MDLRIDSEHSERIVEAMADNAGVEFKPEYSREEVSSMLVANGYDCPVGVVCEFHRKGYLIEPADGVWTAPRIHGLAAALASRRRWLPYPNPRFDQFKTGIKLQVEQMAAQGIAEPFSDLDKQTIEDLLVKVAIEEQSGHREFICEVIRHKMIALGWKEE